MDTKAIYIEWDEEIKEHTGWRYAGDGETLPTFVTATVTRRVRFSNEVTDEMMDRAVAYVEKERPNAWITVQAA